MNPPTYKQSTTCIDKEVDDLIVKIEKMLFELEHGKSTREFVIQNKEDPNEKTSTGIRDS